MRIKIKSFSKVAFLAFLVIALMPAVSYAAADVFDTIQAKMINTVKDIRKIVYVIAGFGLVMFSVLAIFNKISFKHPSYIMISLTILALMMPFIEYFSGYKIEDKELNYDNFLREDDASITGSDTEDTTDCPPGDCPEDRQGVEIERPEENTDQIAPDAPDIAIPEDINGDGVETAEEQTKSLKDVIAGIKGAVDAAHNAMDVIDSVAGAVMAVQTGVAAAGDILSGDGNAFEKIVGLASVGSSTAVSVGSNLSAALGEGMNVAGYFGADGATDALSAIDDLVTEGIGTASGWGSTVDDLEDLGGDVSHLGDRLGGR